MIEIAAQHEAGHAVMRWLCGEPVTRLMAASDGTGSCAGSGRRIASSNLIRILLAGPAAEMGYGLCEIDWKQTRFQDFDEARALLRRSFWLVPRDCKTIEAAPRLHFAAVGADLLPHLWLVEDIAHRLMREGEISARSIASICREYQRRMLVA